MGGGLMQLVAYGAQDVYLTGSPQITFFKVIYRRHTNFSVEPIPQPFTGNADFGRTVTCTINRNGDLITNMYTLINLAAVTGTNPSNDWGYVRRVGLAILQHYKIEIGGSKIDEQYGDWLNIWWELSHKVGQERGFARMVGDVPELTTINSANKPAYSLYVPLEFWFNRNNGLALPLIALQYHDVRITIDFRPAAQCVNVLTSSNAQPSISMSDASLVIDYVYLDSEERKRFAQASHEYLIEQLQFTGSETLSSTNNKYRLNFNHPCKFLIWASHLEKYSTSTNYVAYNTNMADPSVRETYAKLLWLSTRANLTLNGSQWFIADQEASSQEVLSPNPSSDAASKNIDSYVTAQFVFNNLSSGISPSVPASVDNVVLLTNNFGMDDLSSEVENLEILFGANVQFLLSHAVSVQDQFNYGNYLDGTNNPVSSAKLQLNGSDRFQIRDGYYFNYVQPYQHFSCTPADGINVYSFALKPEDHQPSGTCNFSRIDNATLQVFCGLDNQQGDNAYTTEYIGSNSNSLLNIYAVNYNVLRVMSGMAGAAYSN
jgi:hypothetical protein